MRDATGGDQYVGEVEAGDVSWSNELVAHVVELKTADPASSLAPLARSFQGQIRRINELLAPARRKADARRHASLDGPAARNPAVAA